MSYKENLNIFIIIGKKNINNINSNIASYNAASDICLYYESPRNKETKAKQRGNTAKKIYNILVPKKPLIFTYSVRTGNDKSKEITNDKGFAGIKGKKITDIAIKVNRGQVKYQVHVLGGD